MTTPENSKSAVPETPPAAPDLEEALGGLIDSLTYANRANTMEAKASLGHDLAACSEVLRLYRCRLADAPPAAEPEQTTELPGCTLCRAERDRARRTLRSVAKMLGWEHTPPQETLERSIAALKSRVVEQEATGWYCACGHPNGINLAVCACCSRAPGNDNPVTTIYRTAAEPEQSAALDEVERLKLLLDAERESKEGCTRTVVELAAKLTSLRARLALYEPVESGESGGTA